MVLLLMEKGRKILVSLGVFWLVVAAFLSLSRCLILDAVYGITAICNFLTMDFIIALFFYFMIIGIPSWILFLAVLFSTGKSKKPKKH